MKRETALRYCREIAQRVHDVNGMVATPVHSHEYCRIRRIWVFGSTVKGSQSPNDLDLLIDIKPCGRRRSWKQASTCKYALKSFGIRIAKDSLLGGLKWLTHGMKKVSRHTTDTEAAEIDVKVMIYPRWDLSDAHDVKQMKAQ